MMKFRRIFWFIFLICVSILSFYLKELNDKRILFLWFKGEESKLQSLVWYKFLKERFNEKGYKLVTKCWFKDCDALIWASPDYYTILPDYKGKKFAWMMETPFTLETFVRPVWLNQFERIFIYQKEIVDNKKIFYVPVMIRVEKINPDFWKVDKSLFVSQIASYQERDGSIYNERKIAVEWFLNNAPNDFEFYGKGWSKSDFDVSIENIFDEKYKGYVDDKLEVTSKSKFVLAYENAIRNDYVTEKIFDVLKSGFVPIYLGAPNIEEYVPKDCFINKQDFNTYEDLYAYLKNMSEEQYNKYRQCAYKTTLLYQNQHEKIADIIVNGVVEVLSHN